MSELILHWYTHSELFAVILVWICVPLLALAVYVIGQGHFGLGRGGKHGEN